MRTNAMRARPPPPTAPLQSISPLALLLSPPDRQSERITGRGLRRHRGTLRRPRPQVEAEAEVYRGSVSLWVDQVRSRLNRMPFPPPAPSLPYSPAHPSSFLRPTYSNHLSFPTDFPILARLVSSAVAMCVHSLSSASRPARLFITWFLQFAVWPFICRRRPRPPVW